MTVKELIDQLKTCHPTNRVLFFVNWEDEREVGDVAHGDYQDGAITYLGTKNMPDEIHMDKWDSEV